MKRNNNRGFTLIEIIAVIVILGVVFTIAVPAVSSYILDSRKTNYFSTVNSYLETVRGNYEMRLYGDYIDDDEIMIVPISLVHLEKGALNSPFGDYDYDRSYVVITSNGYLNGYYANFLDSAGYGVLNAKSDELAKKSIDKVSNTDIADISLFSTCKDNRYELNSNIFFYNSKEYIPCDYRIVDTSSSLECTSNGELPIIVMCEK